MRIKVVPLIQPREIGDLQKAWYGVRAVNEVLEDNGGQLTHSDGVHDQSYRFVLNLVDNGFYESGSKLVHVVKLAGIPDEVDRLAESVLRGQGALYNFLLPDEASRFKTPHFPLGARVQTYDTTEDVRGFTKASHLEAALKKGDNGRKQQHFNIYAPSLFPA